LSRGSPSLARDLGVTDAVVVGLAAMIGAGVFSAIGAAASGGPIAVLAGLGVAALVAYGNAMSSAQLAAHNPQSGGTYVYGRERLGPFWGYLAGWGFVVGKTASCAAMAMTFAAYTAPDLATPLAAAAVIALTVLDAWGVRRTALVMRIGLAMVLASLTAVVVASVTSPTVDAANLMATTDGAVAGDVLRAGGLLFFAFAGYARIATLGEEVRDPHVTIPRAIPLALTITLVVYAAVAVAALLAVGAGTLADSDAPLTAAAEAGGHRWMVPVTRIGGAVASLGVLLSLLAGVSRTSLAMARDGYLPHALATVHATRRVPHVAQYAVGAIVLATVLLADLRGAIGFSSFAVLGYYAITNVAAWTLPESERRWPRWLAGVGAAGCAVLAFSLPTVAVTGGVGLFAVGALAYAITSRRS